LRRDQWIHEISPALAQHCVDFTTSTTQVLVVVECFPQVEEGLWTRLGSSIKQNTNLRVQYATESSEQPSVGVDLFAVLLLQAEHHLDRRQSRWTVIERSNELLVGRHGQLSGVLELEIVNTSARYRRRLTNNVCRGFLSVNVLLHDSVLVDTDCRQDIQCTFVARIDTVEHQTYYNFLPCRTSFVPEFRLFEVYNIADVLHDAVERSSSQDFVLVVVCDGDQKLSMTVVHGRSEIVAVLQCEVVRIASSSGVCDCQ